MRLQGGGVSTVEGKLKHFHVSFFATVMGVAGLALAWQRAHEVLGVPRLIGQALAVTSALLFVAVVASYGLKYLRHRDAVLAELHHPIKLSFFPAFSISLALLAMLALSSSVPVARILWLAGAAVHLVLTLYVMTQWIYQPHFTIQHSTPAWFIPVVGNILLPIAAVPLGYAEAGWFFFSIGLVFWLVLKVLVFNRFIFHDPLPARLLPTMFILVAPPSIGFLAYLRLNGGELNDFARILYFFAAFLVLLLLVQYRRYAHSAFFLSWWAYSFPLAAFAIASQVYYLHTQAPFFLVVAWAALGLASVVIAALALKTLQVVANGSVFQPD
jgi:tellurite resistance protein